MRISRRSFLETTAFGSLAANAVFGAEISKNGGLPTRVLGRTGARVSILAMGGGSRFLMYKEEDKALEALNRAFDLGITYMDTAYGYGSGLSETRVGKVLKERRKKDGIFLATKIEARNGDEAARTVEGSLKRLQTDQIDLVHIHSLEDEEDLKQIEAKGNILDRLLKFRDEKAIRFVGITCHNDPTVLAKALERHDFDCTQMALNAALVGMKSGHGMEINEAMKTSFETVALPVALRKKMGVIAMKIYAQEGLTGKAPAEKLLYYSLSLPVSLAVVGMPSLDFIEQNVQMTRAFKPLPKSEMQQLSGTLAPKHKMALDRRFAKHVDA
ncbi:MAG: aldo/keto reductase [Acidobacteria bacterium]|nr:MAG: aldo/keto reductase [Acidobacteriota bacterium]